MREPQEIEDRGHEQAVARVAAVDVAKASGMVCTRVPREDSPGRFVTRVWPVEATTNAILELADHLVPLQVQKVVLESASDYWRPFFCLLEAAGLAVDLVNARDVKNAPGRPKTGQAGRGMAGEAGRVGDAAALVRAAAGDPPAAGLHPAAH